MNYAKYIQDYRETHGGAVPWESSTLAGDYRYSDEVWDSPLFVYGLPHYQHSFGFAFVVAVIAARAAASVAFRGRKPDGVDHSHGAEKSSAG